MFLLSTLTNYANDLSPQERLEYLAVVMCLPVQQLRIDTQDRLNTVLDAEQEEIAVVSDAHVEEVFAEASLSHYVKKIRERAYMISPIGEWGALGNIENRTRRTA